MDDQTRDAFEAITRNAATIGGDHAQMATDLTLILGQGSSTCEEELAAEKANHAATQADLNQAQVDLKQEEAFHALTHGRLAEAQQELAASEQQVELLEQSLTACQEQVRMLHETVARLDQTMQDERTAHESTRDELALTQAELETARSANTILKLEVATLKVENAALQVELNLAQTSNDILREEIAALNAEIGRLQAEIARLQAIIDGTEPPPPTGGDDPAPDGTLLVSGPTLEPGRTYTGQQMGKLYISPNGNPFPGGEGWPAYTRPQGQRPYGWCEAIAAAADRFRMTLRRAGHPTISATTLHEQHLPLTANNIGGHKRVSAEMAWKKISVEQYRTIKMGIGFVGFNDRNWDNWPGGGGHSGENFSCRVVANSDGPGNGARWSLYMYLGLDTSQFDFTYEGAPNPRYSIMKNWVQVQKGYQVEVISENGPEILNNVNYRVRLELEAGTTNGRDGSARLLVSTEGGPWEQIMRLSDLTFHVAGNGEFTRNYISLMYGGTDESFAPQNPTQTGIIEMGDIEIHQLA